MKNQIVYLFIILNSFFVNAQENVKVCDENQANFKKFIQENNFDDAQLLINNILKNCPSANENFYIDTEKLHKHNLEFATTDAEKLASIQDLIKNYDLFDKKFPDNKHGNTTKKAIYLYDNNIGSKNDVYTILDKLFTSKPQNFINPRAFYIYYELFEKKSLATNSIIKLDDLISKNIAISKQNNTLQNLLNTEIDLIL